MASFATHAAGLNCYQSHFYCVILHGLLIGDDSIIVHGSLLAPLEEGSRSSFHDSTRTHSAEALQSRHTDGSEEEEDLAACTLMGL